MGMVFGKIAVETPKHTVVKSGDGYEITGDYVLARYNPPWTLPPFKTNEVMIPVERRNHKPKVHSFWSQQHVVPLCLCSKRTIMYTMRAFDLKFLFKMHQQQSASSDLVSLTGEEFKDDDN